MKKNKSIWSHGTTWFSRLVLSLFSIPRGVVFVNPAIAYFNRR